MNKPPVFGTLPVIAKLEPFVIYQGYPVQMELTVGDLKFDQHAVLHSGRTGYDAWEHLISQYTGVPKNLPGPYSDFTDAEGRGFEAKAFHDLLKYPDAADLFNTGASCLTGANNHGKKIKKLLDKGDRDGALAICVDKGYSKNSYYLFHNTADYAPETRFSFIMIPTDWLLEHLAADPRLIKRSDVWGSAVRTEELTPLNEG